MPIRCIQCGGADLETKRISLEGTVRGQNYTVEMEGLACPRCNYNTIEGSAMPEYGRLLADRFRADHGLLTSDAIRARRERLGMSQLEFASHVGVGVASIKRWEMGKIQDQRNDYAIRRATDPKQSATWWQVPRPIVTSTSASPRGGGIGYLKRIRTACPPDELLVHQTMPPQFASLFV